MNIAVSTMRIEQAVVHLAQGGELFRRGPRHQVRLERQLAIQGTDLGRAPHIVKGIWLVRQDVVGETHTRKLRRMLSIDRRPIWRGRGFSAITACTRK